MPGSRLRRRDLDPDPVRQFAAWYAAAVAAGEPEPDTAALATAGPDGRPSVRFVLLKGHGPEGFTFFTDYRSRKARDLDVNPHAALAFRWPRLRRQVRVEGRVERVPDEESDAYFATRPLDSRLAAWASEQSRPVPDRATLEARVEEVRARFAGREVPRPPTWGGYRVRADRLEFWQHRDARLHDRFVYERRGDAWRIERLQP